MPTDSNATAAYDADIIILTLGRFEATLAAVRSALGQQGATIRVWLLDQGSPAEIRAAYADAFADQPRVGLHFADRNLGVPGGRNFLSGLGTARAIVALDNDATFATPFVVRDAVAALDAAPDVAAIGFRILAACGTKLDLSSWGYPKPLLPRATEAFDATTFVGAGHAIRRAAFAQAGGYDAALFFAWEEYDLSLRAIAAGWRIRYDGTLAVIHKVSGEARVSWQGDRARHHIRNRLVIARKWGASWAGLAPRIAAYLIKGALHGCARATLAGIADAGRRDPPTRRRAPTAMRAYLAANESKHRGTLRQRLRLEVLARPGG